MTLRGSDVLPGEAPDRRGASGAALSGQTVLSFPGSMVKLVCSLVARPRINKVLRYALTSGVTTGISEVTLLALYASGILGATGASVIANLAGTVPSYLLSRYWIWPEADRRGAARQMGLYWATSAVSLVVSTAGTSLAGAYAPAGHMAHVIVVGTAYIGTVTALWVAKFIVYQRIIFSSAAGVENDCAA